ncbi:hypothetical protein ABZW02_31225 [Streptomyces sp. NPDC005180]|uniref:hypothetical protein n=1 Tax=Streptomyces sp. NPDC005180 TaxID=3156868 RepID=UPI0033BA7CC2
MTSPTRNVLSLDTPDGSDADTADLAPPSADLLDRALAGWQRFLRTEPAVADE